MPRQPRLDLPGVYSHVMVRGIERRRIFRQTGDYVDFLKRLSANLARSGCRCFAWALMPNHLHLLILSGIRGIVSLMHPLLTGYAVRFNVKYRRVGHLFQNRYNPLSARRIPIFWSWSAIWRSIPSEPALFELPKRWRPIPGQVTAPSSGGMTGLGWKWMTCWVDSDPGCPRQGRL